MGFLDGVEGERGREDGGIVSSGGGASIDCLFVSLRIEELEGGGFLEIFDFQWDREEWR
jgi:hypothetical protein